MLLVQALRLHLAEGVRGGAGWFFALSGNGLPRDTLYGFIVFVQK